MASRRRPVERTHFAAETEHDFGLFRLTSNDNDRNLEFGMDEQTDRAVNDSQLL